MENGIFRLSAVLADENLIDRKSIVLRLINYIFLDTGNNLITVKRLRQKIKKDFSLDFTHDEIERLLQGDGFENFGSNLDKQYRMINSHFCELKLKNDDHLNTIISKYYNLKINNQAPITFESFRGLINTYLYDVYNSEIARISTLFDFSISYTPSPSLTEVEVQYINGFLEWDDIEKNKLIYGLASLALEYCMLTTNVEFEQLKNMFKNKVFFIDTNILVAILGLNGYIRLQQTEFLFKKFTSKNITVKVGRNVIEEFSSFLNKRIKNIISLLNGGSVVDPILLENRIEEGTLGVYQTYYNWVREKGTTNFELFKSYVELLLDAKLAEYGISIDESAIIENYEKSSDYKPWIESLSAWKNILEDSPSFSIIQTDVISILHVNQLRGGISRRDLSSECFFLMSTDGQLIEWRNSINKDKIALISKPSIWANIMLRFDTRTDDDYRSFSNFLSKGSKFEEPIDIDKARLMLDVIKQYTTVLEEKNELIDVIIRKYSTSMINQKSNDDFKEMIKSDVDETHAKMMDLKLSKLKDDYGNEIQEIKKQLESTSNALLEQRDSYTQLRDKVKTIEVDNQELEERNLSLKKLSEKIIRIVSYLVYGFECVLFILSVILILLEILSYKINLFNVPHIVRYVIENNRQWYYIIYFLPSIFSVFLINTLNSYLTTKREEIAGKT